MKRIIKWADEMRDLSAEDRARLQRVNCGPNCEYCGFPNRGISIGKLDSLGDEYPDATSVVLDKRAHEWVVYVYDEDALTHQREAKRYPVDQVEAIRNLPVETRLYNHWVLEDVEPDDEEEQRVPESHAAKVRELREKFLINP